MDKSQQLFLFGCIPVRILLAYLAKNANKQMLHLMGYLGLIIALGFTYIYLTGSRKTGPETFGRPIWWNNWRPIHAGLYFAFAYTALHGCGCAWRYLATDVVVGLIAFIMNYCI